MADRQTCLKECVHQWLSPRRFGSWSILPGPLDPSGTRGRANVLEGGRVHPGMPLARIITAAGLELLEETNHAGPPELPAQRRKSSATNLIKSPRHCLSPGIFRAKISAALCPAGGPIRSVR